MHLDGAAVTGLLG